MSQNINAEDVTVTQTANDILTDPCASYWLKDAVRALERRDPVDAFLDATRLLECFRARLEALHGRRVTSPTAASVVEEIKNNCTICYGRSHEVCSACGWWGKVPPEKGGQKIMVHGYELECPVPPCYKEDR